MGRRDSIDRIWDVIENVGVCMLTTHAASGLRARPLEARPDRGAGLIWFVTDRRSGKENEIEAVHDVGLVFIDSKKRPTFRSRRAQKYEPITPRPPKSGEKPTAHGGRDPTIRTSA